MQVKIAMSKKEKLSALLKMSARMILVVLLVRTRSRCLEIAAGREEGNRIMVVSLNGSMGGIL